MKRQMTLALTVRTIASEIEILRVRFRCVCLYIEAYASLYNNSEKSEQKSNFTFENCHEVY